MVTYAVDSGAENIDGIIMFLKRATDDVEPERDTHVGGPDNERRGGVGGRRGSGSAILDSRLRYLPGTGNGAGAI